MNIKTRCKLSLFLLKNIELFPHKWYIQITLEGGKRMKQEKPILIYQKNADIEKNRVIIPKFFVDKFGRQFYMEIYEDRIVLKPIKKGE